MRLKEDDSSYKAKSIINSELKREPLKDVETKPKSKKNTKKWCKGKVGVEHQYEYAIKTLMGGYVFFKVEKCKVCGKETDKKLWKCNKCGEYRESDEYWKCCKGIIN